MQPEQPLPPGTHVVRTVDESGTVLETRRTIIGLGSLLSERSARTTFPKLGNFRLGRVEGFRRVFAHSPSIFVSRGIANTETLEMSSIAAEPCEGASFLCAIFDVPDEGMERFREREEEARDILRIIALMTVAANRDARCCAQFELIHAPFTSLEPARGAAACGGGESGGGVGMLCLSSTDAGRALEPHAICGFTLHACEQSARAERR